MKLAVLEIRFYFLFKNLVFAAPGSASSKIDVYAMLGIAVAIMTLVVVVSLVILMYVSFVFLGWPP